MPRAVFTLPVLILLLGAASAPEEEAVVPTERCGPYFILRVSVGGETPHELSMLLDTGAAETSVDRSVLKSIHGAAVSFGSRVMLENASAGPLDLGDLRVTARELDFLRFVVGRPVDGILGYPALRGIVLTVDYPAGEVRVGSTPLPPVNDREILKIRGERLPHVAVKFGEDVVSLLIDTASPSPFVVRHGHALGGWDFEPVSIGTLVRPRRIERREAGRLSGDIAFGPGVLTKPIVELTDAEDRVGTGVLEHFALTFDTAGRRIRIVPASRKPIRLPPIRSTGALIAPKDGRLQVIGILESTPAEIAGLERRDLVIALDGVATTFDECTERRRRKPPRRRVYTIERDGEVRDVKLEFVDLVP